MTRKAVLLGVGLWLGMSTLVAAGGRSRVASNGAGAAAPSTGTAVRGAHSGDLQGSAAWLDKYKVSRDGSVRLADMTREFGSAGRWHHEMVSEGKKRYQLPDGTVVYADGTVAYYADLVSPAVAAAGSKQAERSQPRVEQRKHDARWIQFEVAGHPVGIFADGTVTPESAKALQVPAWAVKRQHMQHRVINGMVVYADGTVYKDEPVE